MEERTQTYFDLHKCLNHQHRDRLMQKFRGLQYSTEEEVDEWVKLLTMATQVVNKGRDGVSCLLGGWHILPGWVGFGNLKAGD